jgi:uncharacterized surface protein with fasciclin (FAS1) repeats
MRHIILALMALFAINTAQAVETKDVIEVIQSNPNYSTLSNLLFQADLVNTLQGQGPYTIFAPTNAAFAKLPPQTLQDLNKHENKDKLIAILKFHIIPKSMTTQSMSTMSTKTLSHRELDIRVQGAEIIINGNARIVKPNLDATNGVVQIVDTVLIPKN